MNNYHELIINLKKQMKKQKISQKQLSCKTNITQATISRAFNFKRKIKLDTYLTIKEFLDKGEK